MRYAQWDISDFLEGVRGLTPPQIGIYSVILPLMYANMGMLRDDDRYIAGHCHCDVRTYRKIKAELIEIGKIYVREGYVYNNRAIKEIARFCASAKLKRSAALEREAKKRRPGETDTQFAQAVRTPCANHAPSAHTLCSEKSELPNDNNVGLTTALPLPSTQTEIEIESTPLPPKRGRRCKARQYRKQLCQVAFDRYRSMAEPIGLSVPRATSFDSFAADIFARLVEHGGSEASDSELLAIWDEALNKVAISPWLLGNNDRQFKASLSFICQAKSFKKLLDGAYGDGARAQRVDSSQAIVDSEIHLRNLARRFELDGVWDGNGPEPGTPGSIVSADILAEVRTGIARARASGSSLKAVGGGHAHAA